MRMTLLLLSLGLFTYSAQCQDQAEPILRSSLMPTYPPIAAVAHITGDVRASFVLDADGNVVSVKILSGPPLLHDATEKNIQSWKFSAATEKSAANRSYDTVFYYRISSRTACENNRWITVSTGSFHAIEITTDGLSVVTSSNAKTAPSSRAGATSR
jgi:TonB family protein